MTAGSRLSLLNRSLLLQVGAVLVFCQLLAHALSIAFIIWRFEKPDLLTATSVSTTQAVGFYEALGAATPAERTALEGAIARAHPTVTLLAPRAIADAIPNPRSASEMLEGLVKARPEVGRNAILLPGATQDPADDLIALPLPDGRWMAFQPELGEQRVTFPRLVAVLFVAMLVVPLLVMPLWGLKMLTAPLRTMAQNAERFSIDLDPTPMPERGPTEFRALAHAFNTMKGRIHQLIDGRSRMLAAVSHDLRTPLTRLRLRAETLPEGDDRDRMLKDIVTMNDMIGHTLSYLRDHNAPTAREPVDLPALLESICNDFADTGHSAHYRGPRHVTVECEPDLITRAVSNLVDNGIKFGGNAVVSLEARWPTEVLVRVEDDGPGIMDAQKLTAFEPFARGDRSRAASETEGFGLGLAIARQIVERHGGSITLQDRKPTGLMVQFTLPIGDDARAGADRVARMTAPAVEETRP